MVGFSQPEQQMLAQVLREHRTATRKGKRKHPDESDAYSSDDRQRHHKISASPASDVSIASEALSRPTSLSADRSDQKHVAQPQSHRRGSSRLKLHVKPGSERSEKRRRDQTDPFAFDEPSGPPLSSNKPRPRGGATAFIAFSVRNRWQINASVKSGPVGDDPEGGGPHSLPSARISLILPTQFTAFRMRPGSW